MAACAVKRAVLGVAPRAVSPSWRSWLSDASLTRLRSCSSVELAISSRHAPWVDHIELIALGAVICMLGTAPSAINHFQKELDHCHAFRRRRSGHRTRGRHRQGQQRRGRGHLPAVRGDPGAVGFADPRLVALRGRVCAAVGAVNRGLRTVSEGLPGFESSVCEPVGDGGHGSGLGRVHQRRQQRDPARGRRGL